LPEASCACPAVTLSTFLRPVNKKIPAVPRIAQANIGPPDFSTSLPHFHEGGALNTPTVRLAVLFRDKSTVRT
jgi:hypothetical protein